MKKSLFFLCFLLSAMTFSSVAAQNDYIVTVDDKTISGITITSFPQKLEYYTVNVYNDNLMPKYEDLKIIYSSPKSKKPVTI